MFLDFCQMRDQPFGVAPDPRFLYLGKSSICKYYSDRNENV
jgi:hypothetical protein